VSQIQPHEEISLKAAKVLIVDDRPENIFALQTILRETDADIFSADSGEEALALCLRHHFAVILMDVQMPGMSGFETADYIRENDKTKHTPIIFLTAISKDERYVHKGYAKGAVDYIFKPLDPLILLGKVNVFLDLQRQRSKQAYLLEVLDRKQSELCEANEKLIEQNEKLAQLNEEKNCFLGMASHDLRNPLGAILGIAQLLLKESLGPLKEEQTDMLNTVEQAANTTLRLVEDFLDITTIESSDMQLVTAPVDMSALVKRVVAHMKASADEKNISLVLMEYHGALHVTGDESRLEQVLVNLISNAMKYSFSESKVSIEVRKKGGEIRVSVTDQGQGIPDQEQKKLFIPFSKTSVRPTGGETSTGLGLAIVHRIIGFHKGTVGVESEPGKGSCFYFSLPMLR
jgi:signal transduction histidine kinase